MNIVHCQKHPYSTYIGRPKAGQEWGFGNPFVIGKDGDRLTVIDKMHQWLESRKSFGNKDATPERRQWILDNLHLIREAETIGCWCDYPKEDCHGRILIEQANKVLDKKITLAIIGTAGRGEDANKLTAHHYQQMILAAKKVIELERVTHLVSGGAAWADFSAHESSLPKKIFLPSLPKDVETAKYYHRKFFEKVPDCTDFDDVQNAEIIHGGGFLDRNLLVAAEADIFLAMTFGNGNEVKDGGTKHTVDNMLKQGKFGYHLDLGTCRLWKNAK